MIMTEKRLDALALEYAAVFYATRDRALMPSSEWDLCLTAALRTYQHLGLDPENPPAEGAVGKAREALIMEQCHCREYRNLEKPGCQECPVVKTCRVLVALRALGGGE